MDTETLRMRRSQEHARMTGRGLERGLRERNGGSPGCAQRLSYRELTLEQKCRGRLALTLKESSDSTACPMPPTSHGLMNSLSLKAGRVPCYKLTSHLEPYEHYTESIKKPGPRSCKFL